MKSMIKPALLFVMVAVLARPLYSQYGSGKASGTVIGRDGKPMADVVISIDRKDISQHIEVKTDKKGQYFRPGLDSGTYRIAVVERGITLAAADNLRLTFDDRLQQDFDLRKQTQVAGAAAKPPVDKAQKEAENRANAETQGAFNLGVAAFEAGNFEEAIKQFSLAAEKRPKMYVIFARLAAANVEAKKFNEATDAYKKAIELKPDDANFFYNMGLSACRANRVPECVEGIRKAVDLDPARGTSAYFNLGSLLAGKGLGKEADDAFQKSLAHDPNNAETQYQIALLYLKDASTIPNAIPYLEKYLKIAPTGPNAATVKQMLETVKTSK